MLCQKQRRNSGAWFRAIRDHQREVGSTSLFSAAAGTTRAAAPAGGEATTSLKAEDGSGRRSRLTCYRSRMRAERIDTLCSFGTAWTRIAM